MLDAAAFGRYLLRERIARGGMGEVFKATAIGANGFEKPVILKRILPDHASASSYVDAFVAEAKRMSLLAHPNIVQVIDFGVGGDDDYFLVLELVDGMDLDRLRRRYEERGVPFPIELALFIADGVLRGLHHAHTQSFPDGAGLVHRDVSPSNVLLSKVGEVKVADFGVALVVAKDSEARAGDVAGKLHYMAPEQLDGGPIDARADVFAFGVTLFQLLTGALPYEERDAIGYRLAAHEGRHRKLRELRPDAPEDLEHALERALDPRADGRFDSARAMAKALASIAARLPARTSADDLADVIKDAIAEAPARTKAVVRLGLGPQAPEALGDVDGEPELTREVKNGTVVFTRRPAPTIAPAPTTEPLDASAPSQAPTPRRAWRAGLLALAAILGGGVAAIAFGRGQPAATASAATAPPPLASTPETNASTQRTSSAQSAEAAPAIASNDPKKAAPNAPPKSAKSAQSTLSAAPAIESCKGTVALFATHGWTVAGGPGVVEAPGRYEWPCGSYALRATSRVDATEVKSGAVVVRQGAQATLDLRGGP